MRIPITDNAPSSQELFQILKDKLSGDYTFRLFGFGKDKSIIVGKDWFTGVQISINDTEFLVERVHPSATSSIFINVLTLFFTGLATPFLSVWELFFDSPWKKLQREIGVFLKYRYK